MSRIKALIDRHTERFISRKFLAWLTATALCAVSILTSSDWVAITLVYIGSQAVVDVALKWKHGYSQDSIT